MAKRKRKETDKTEHVSMRLDETIGDRFARVVQASRRSKTSIIEECLEKVLPELERRFLKEAA